MSLPPAPKDISTHPAKGSVVDPVNKAVKEADVDRKIRLYGILTALRIGKLPSNAQLTNTLNYILTHSLSTSKSKTTSTNTANATANANAPAASRLSPEGKKLVGDLKQIIESTKLMLQEKNADELLQDFIWGVRSVDQEGLKGALVSGDEDVPVGKEKVNKDVDTASTHLRTLLTLLLSNAEVRKLLTDFSLIGRDILARGASAAAQGIAPNPDKLARVDRPAPADEFITENGRVAEEGETPVLEARMPGTDVKVQQHPNDQLGYGAKISGGPVEGSSAEGKKVGDIRNEAVDTGADALGKGVGEAKKHAGDVANADEPGAEVEGKKGGVMGRVRQMRDTVRDNFNSDKIPREHKDLANEKLESGKKFFSEEYFPEERRDQFVFRGKKVILELQKHDNYQESIRWLISTVEEYLKHGRTLGKVGRDRVGSGVQSSNLNTSLFQLRTLLERFANGTSLDVVFDAVDALVDDTRRDEALRVWWESVGVYIKKVLLEPGYVLEPDCTTHAKKLRDLGREFYEGKYRAHFEGLFDAVGAWFGGVGEDPINKQFAGDWARLTKDLLFDSEGGLKFKPELWNDIRKVILPAVIDQVGYIPIPRIEYTDESLDLVVENLTLQGRNLLPNIVSFEANNFIRFSPYNAISSVDPHGRPVDEMLNKHRFTVHLEQMQADMRDVAFYYRKKTGIARMKDSGIADVVVGGDGLSVLIELTSSPPQDRTSTFKIHSIQVKLDSLKFSIRDSNHDFLYKTLRPLATGLIKKQIQGAVRDAVRTGLEYLDGQLVGVRERMREGKERAGDVAGDGEKREGVLRDIFARTTNKNASTKDKADDALSTATGGARSTGSSSSGGGKYQPPSQSQFKIVADKRNSILADQGNPAGWVNKVEERRGMVETQGGVTGAGVGGGMAGGGKGKGVGVGPGFGEEEVRGWKSDAFHVV